MNRVSTVNPLAFVYAYTTPVPFLDELLVVRTNMFFLRLANVPFHDSGFSDSSLAQPYNGKRTSSFIPGPIGTLPVDQFIYYLIGALVLLICSVAIWTIFKAMLFPRRYFESTKTLTSIDPPPPYRARRPPASARVNTIIRDELGRHRTETKYQTNGYPEPPPVVKPNLPLPLVREIVVADNSDDGWALQDIGAWENLVKEKAKLNVSISNLQRIDEARRQGGEFGAINPRLQAALLERAKVENEINATYERFRAKREEWKAEEWQVVELIMEYSR